MTKSAQYLDCQLGPDAQGNFVKIKMDLMDYQIMCKQTDDFCNCETGAVTINDEEAAENVIKEIYLTRTVTQTVYADEKDIVDMSKESN